MTNMITTPPPVAMSDLLRSEGARGFRLEVFGLRNLV